MRLAIFPSRYVRVRFPGDPRHWGRRYTYKCRGARVGDRLYVDAGCAFAQQVIVEKLGRGLHPGRIKRAYRDRKDIEGGADG